jgi:hypothetical protein
MSDMEPSGSNVPGVESTGQSHGDAYDLRYADGALAGDITVHASNQADGSIRAQLELRFEDFECAITAPEVGVSTPGHSSGRTWVLVEVEPRQSYTNTLRLSIDIPMLIGRTSQDIGDAQAAIAQIDGSRQTIAAMQARCAGTEQGDYLLRVLDALRHARELADDGSKSSVVALAAQSLHAQSPDT